ncbi:hypothetical protein [Lacrimispora sp.]|uniref:hypothetical protein n=1 Tax=Lacrimispora sp. TaxID=2719234 RepID=UPI0028569287|nr:hypothetical protein [Lacrimispora sp.]MDR7814647.1 hypothetical protein [Lacrimispora sp.]
MSNIEKIKFGDQAFDLVAAGVDLGESGGTIKFQKGRLTFDEIKALLKEDGSITQIGLSGNPDWSRDDLVYAGQLAEKSDCAIGIAEDGITEVKADVMIAAFRTPDLNEIVAAQAAEIKALTATVDTLVLSSLEV